MSDALSVLLVPDADETTRQVLTALRNAALAADGPATLSESEDASESSDASPTMLLRWGRRDDASIRLGDDLRPVRADDGRVLYYESTLSETAPTASAEPADESLADNSLVAPLLAFVAAAEQARSRADACQAAVVAAKRVLGADLVFVLMQAETGVAVEAASFGFAAETRAQLSEATAWTTYRLPRISTAISALGRETDALAPDIVRASMEQEGMVSAIALPLMHRHLPVGVIWAFFAEPQRFDVAARQRGGLLAHHLAGTLVHVHERAQASAGSSEALTRANEATPRPDESAPPPLPVKTLLGLAAAAAYGIERADEESWRVAWVTKSLRGVLGVSEDAELDLDAITAAFAEDDRAALQAAYASLDIGASTRLEHPITLATGEARRVRHALQRVREDGRDQVLAVLVALGPAHPNDADEAPAADGLDAPLLASLGQALRGPLTTLLDEADTLTRTPRLDTEDYQGAARQIAAEGRRLMATLNLVVDLARIESGEASLVRSDLLLGHELRKVVGLLEPLATKRDLVLDADLDAADHIAVHQDPIALSRVLHHLVGTAIAEVSPGVLRIRVRHSARSASIELEGTTTSDHALSAAVMHQPFGGAIAERLVARMAGSLTESKDDEACRWTLTLPTVERMPATTASVIASPAAVSEQAVAKMEGFATDMPDSGTPDVGTPDVAAPGIEALEVELPEKVDVDSAEGPASPVVPEAADMLNALPSALDETEDEALEAEAFAMPPADTLPSPDFEEAPVPSLPDLDALFPMPNGGDGGPRSEEPEEPEAPRRPRHAFPSIEAAANAFLLADDLHFSARPLVHRDTSAGAATPPGAAEPAGAAEAGVEQTDSSRPAPRYERTEVPLPVGVRLSTPSAVHNEEPAVAPQAPDEEATPPSSVPTADTAPRAFDTALDAFASVEAEHIDVSDLDPADDEVSRLASKVDAPPAGSHEGPGSQPPRLAVEGPARVLIVEDNSETRILLERLIGREFETVAVESPRAALDQLTQQQFHALVLDIHLGGRETGVDILRIARTLDGYADTFAMAVTAFGERSDRERFIEAGFNAYVQKPFVPEALLAPLREALQPA